MRECISQGPLNKRLRRMDERTSGREILVERTERHEEALQVAIPAMRSCCAPNHLALCSSERPFKQIAEVSHDQHGTPGGRRDGEIVEPRRGVTEDLGCAVCERREQMPKQSACGIAPNRLLSDVGLGHAVS